MEKSKPNKTPCPKCGNPLRLAGLPAGELVHCPKCNAAITVGGDEKPPSGPKPSSRPRSKTPDAVGGKKPSPSGTAPSAEPSIVVTPGATGPSVVAVNPFEQRTPGELPIAARASGDGPDDDDAYEPEIPLIPSAIVPQEPIQDANLGSTNELWREAPSDSGDALELEEHTKRRQVDADLHLESARKRGLVREHYTPPPPRYTFLSGVFGFPWRGLNIGRWALTSVLLSIAVVLDFQALAMLGLLGGNLTQMALPGLLLAVFAIGMTVFAGMFTAPTLQTAVQDTADGHDLPQEGTFPDWDQWVFTLLGWISLGAAAAALGYPLSLAIGPVAMLISAVLLFPVLLLSAMESDSYLVPISPPVVRSLGSNFGSWLGFYVVSGLLLAATAVAASEGLKHFPPAMLLAGPVLGAVGLIYCRLLGRLAWKISGASMAIVELSTDTEGSDILKAAQATAAQKRKKRSRIKIVVPEEIDRDDSSEERPRISFHHRP